MFQILFRSGVSLVQDCFVPLSTAFQNRLAPFCFVRARWFASRIDCRCSFESL